MSGLEAARDTDEIGHSGAPIGFMLGVLAGAAIAVATGGTGLVLIAGVMAGAAAGGLAGKYIGEAVELDPSGRIVTGSPNVIIGRDKKAAARAELDFVLCDKHQRKPIAQGSLTVIINGHPAARKSDKIQCDAKIRRGWPTVIFGGPAITAVVIDPEIPDSVVYVTVAIGAAGAVIGFGAAVVAVGFGAALTGVAVSFVGGTVGSVVLGAIGEKLDGEVGKRVGQVTGGMLGGAAMGRAFSSFMRNRGMLPGPTVKEKVSFPSGKAHPNAPRVYAEPPRPFQGPKRIVYRGDRRPMDEVFEKGFTQHDPRGRVDLATHQQAQPGNTPWISTSKDPRIASNPYFAGYERQTYVVRTRGGVDVNRALGPYSKNVGEQEVAFRRPIQPNEIVGAYRRDFETGKVVWTPNPRYDGPPVNVPPPPLD